MVPDLAINDGMVELTWGRVRASVDAGGVQFAHLGCKSLGGFGGVPEELADECLERYGRKRRKGPAFERVAGALRKTLERASEGIPPGSCPLRGVTLWDTMRKGSRFWRPGDLLARVAETLRRGPREPVAVSYGREDILCPPGDLLAAFMDEMRELSYGEFAQSYCDYLHHSQALPYAAAGVILDVARGLLPVFYCVDPYIPGYGRREEALLGIPYSHRAWCSELRTVGCHRFVLAEETARFFLALGVPASVVYEIDPTLGDCYRQEYTT